MRLATRIALPIAMTGLGVTLISAVPATAESMSAPVGGKALYQIEPALLSAQTPAIAPTEVVSGYLAPVNFQTLMTAAGAAYEANLEAIREAVRAEAEAQAAAAAQAEAASRAQSGSTGAGSASYSGGGAVGVAMSLLGSPYVSGGTGPGGFDCSGFVRYVYAQVGVSLPGGSYNQINSGQAVDFGSLAPGDLVFYGPGGSQHVAIYIGNGQVVQASNPSTGVHVASIYYIGQPTGFRRV